MFHRGDSGLTSQASTFLRRSRARKGRAISNIRQCWIPGLTCPGHSGVDAVSWREETIKHCEIRCWEPVVTPARTSNDLANESMWSPQKFCGQPYITFGDRLTDSRGRDWGRPVFNSGHDGHGEAELGSEFVEDARISAPATAEVEVVTNNDFGGMGRCDKQVDKLSRRERSELAIESN